MCGCPIRTWQLARDGMLLFSDCHRLFCTVGGLRLVRLFRSSLLVVKGQVLVLFEVTSRFSKEYYLVILQLMTINVSVWEEIKFIDQHSW